MPGILERAPGSLGVATLGENSCRVCLRTNTLQNGNDAKTPNVHAAQGGVNEHTEQKKSPCAFGTDFDRALMRHGSTENLMRQARTESPKLMTIGRYISQRLPYTLR
jgi:hypothetical protein